MFTKTKEDKRNQNNLITNADSINFLIQIPHIYVYIMAWIETSTNKENHNKIRESIKHSINNIVKGLNDTPYEMIYKKMNKNFNVELFNVMIKMTQFLYILMRKDKDLENNQNLLKHAREQIDNIKFDEIIKSTLNLLKNCPDDFEIMNRLKYLINCMNEKHRLKDINELISYEVILGRNKFISEYTKNALYNFCIDIIKTLFVTNSQK